MGILFAASFLFSSQVEGIAFARAAEAPSDRPSRSKLNLPLKL
jgi:hypothetical protein